jgi:hypothetical protein
VVTSGACPTGRFQIHFATVSEALTAPADGRLRKYQAIGGLGLFEERTGGKFQIYRHKSSKFIFRYERRRGF